MADLAIGISKTAVQFLADKVKSAMKEEAEQWQTLQQNLVFIMGEFDMMQSFLTSADGERVKNHVVRTWVRQVRHLSNDVEDCIELVLHLDTEQSWWLRLLPSISCSSTERSELPLDEAVTLMKQLKIRVDDVNQRYLRYRFGSEAITQQQFMSPSAIGSPGFDILVEAKDTVARCRGGIDLTKLVTARSNNDLRVISLWRTGDDLGTMSVIRNMYDNPTICGNFRCRAWVKVMHPVNPHDLIRSLVVQFYANSCHEQGGTVSTDSQPWLCRLIKLKKRRDALSWTETSFGDLVQEFLRQVNTHQYLIILEDLSTVVQWDAIKPYLRDRKNGSCIVVSTPHHEIASLCTGKPYQVSELQRFSGNQTICVFFNAGFKDAGANIVEQESPSRRFKVNRLVGRDLEVKKLSNLIMIKDRPSTHKPRVISVWGLPGSGRTEVVKNVCCDCYAESGSDWNDMVILSCFSESSFQAENPIERCREFLHEHPCLVVIDDMPSKEFWDSIKAENIISSKSCIVVITTEKSVAIHCAGSDDLVCSITCLQPMAAFDLLQQEFQKQVSRNDRNLSEEQTFLSRRYSFDFLNYLFESDRPDEHKCQNNEDQTFQNNGSSSGNQAFQNNGNTLEDQEHRNQENTTVEEAFQSNGNPSGQQAFQNGTSFEEQALQNNGNSVNGQAFQNWRNLLKEQLLRYHGDSSFDQAFEPLLETNRQEEHAFQVNENLFEGQAFQNSENLLAEQTSYNSEDIFDEPPLQKKGKDDFRKICQSEINKNMHVNLSLDDPNVKALLSRSGGFPKVIVALGRYLAKQHLSNVGIWEWHCQHLIGNFMQELQTNPEFYCLRSLLARMRSYFRSSPSLMRCMLYLLIFPREQTFQRTRLVWRWIAEGYTKDTESSSSMQEFAVQLFDKLTSQSVMRQVTTASMETRYVVNGFFHEYMISRPMEEKLFFPLEVSVLEEDYCRVTTEGVGQHLTIWSSWDRKNRIVFDNLDLLRLRSLTVFGRWEPFFISEKMRVLRVLDLENACDVSDKDVEQIGKVLLRLKFLSLTGCKRITRVPDSLAGLRQLQTLDIWGTSVATLPRSITKLKTLQYLRAYLSPDATTADLSLSTPSTSGPGAGAPTLEPLFQLPESWTCGSRNGGVVVPRSIGQMTALHILGVIDVGVASGRAILKELKSLTQLRKLGLSGVSRENCQELCSAILGHAHLDSLSVWFDEGKNRAGCLNAISRPLTWVKPPANLGKLNLQTLGNLRKLRTLCLYCIQGDELEFSGGFGELRLLQIACNSTLQAVTFHGEAMRNLEVLNIPCNSVPSTLRFTGIKQLLKLKEVSLSGSYDDELKQQLQSQLGEHPREMKPVLKVEPRSS